MANTLQRSLTAGQFFTLSFSAIVGVGWIVVLGDWLSLGGPAGAIMAFAAAGLVMMLVGLCYAELATIMPTAGGELAYVFSVFGPRAGFLIGWLLALVYISVTAFQALSAGFLAGVLFPQLLGPELYRVRGLPVAAGTILLGIGGTVLLTVLNLRGIRSSGRFQNICTWLKIATAMLLVGAGIVFGKVQNLEPLLARTADGSIAGAGLLSVFITAPFWLGGFNTAAQLMEEKAPAVRYSRVAFALLASIAAASVFYGLLILSSAMAMPWKDISRLELPAVGAFSAAFRSQTAAKVVLLSGLVGLLASWNSVFLASSRVLYALGRARMIPHVFARVHPERGSPVVAILFVAALTGACTTLGRGMITPIINMDSACLFLTYAAVALCVMRLRTLNPTIDRPFRIPGGATTAAIALVASALMCVVAFYQPFAANGGRIPVEWTLFLAWLGLGLLAWQVSSRSRNTISADELAHVIMGSARRKDELMRPAPAPVDSQPVAIHRP